MSATTAIASSVPMDYTAYGPTPTSRRLIMAQYQLPPQKAVNKVS